MTFPHKYGIYSVISLAYVLSFVGGEKGQWQGGMVAVVLLCENSNMGKGGDRQRQRATEIPIWLNHKGYRGQLFVEEIQLGSQDVIVMI
jgi:hypothetical protein